MVETSFIPWVLFILSVLICSFSCIRFSGFLPWSSDCACRVSRIFGIVLAPFLFGALSIIVLTVLPADAGHFYHLVFIVLAQLIIAISSLFINVNVNKNRNSDKIILRLSLFEKIILATLSAFVFCLLFNSLFFPLLQNDALEYATVAREFFEKPNLSTYPLLTPEKNKSGFYAPWTHPPLYPAIIYVTYLFQGNADYAGLMRLISPWFAICAVLLTYAIASLIDRKTGLIAAILLISTPIFFLGADSALIDALPVLGFLIVFTTIIGIKSSPIKSGFIQGITLGIALWTHSEAVLFVPLGIACLLILYGIYGVKNWRKFAIQTAVILGSSLLIAAFPYLNNFINYGMLVGDSNPIYDLASLRWDDYFKEDRGLSSTVSLTQYGILKGWFATEYFGLIFWLMSFAVIYFFHKVKPHIYRVKKSSEISQYIPTVLLLSLSVVFFYILGVIISVFIGMDILIRNERYWLITIPFIAIISSWFLVEISPVKKQLLRKSVTFFFLFVFGIVPLSIFSKYRLASSGIHIQELFMPIAEKQKYFPEIRAMEFISRGTEDSVVLTTQPSIMYYSNRKMVSYLDPSLIGFYSAKTIEIAVKELINLGVTHLYITDYSLPPFYNSFLMDIVANPNFTELMYSASGNQVYRLLPANNTTNIHVDYNGNDSNKDDWNRTIKCKILRIMSTTAANCEGIDTLPSRISCLNLPLGLFQRNISAWLSTGDCKNKISVNEGGEYILYFFLSGRAKLSFYLTQMDKAGNIVNDENHESFRDMSIGNLIVTDDKQKNRFIRRIKLHHSTKYLKIAVEHQGNSCVSIDNFTIKEIVGNR